MTDTKGKVVGINGNMVSVQFDGTVAMNEVGYVNVEGTKLKGEVIRIRGNTAQMQIYERRASRRAIPLNSPETCFLRCLGRDFWGRYTMVCKIRCRSLLSKQASS